MSARHHRLSGPRWEATRRALFTSAGWKCQLCGRPGRLEAHHRKPLYRGGAEYDQNNLMALCRTCHIAQTRAQRQRPVVGQTDWRAAAAAAFK